MRRFVFYTCFVSFCVGIVVFYMQVDIKLPTLFLYTGFFATVVILFCYSFLETRKYTPIILLFFLGVLLGASYTSFRKEYPNEYLENKIGEKISLEGTVNSYPQDALYGIRFVLDTDYGKVIIRIPDDINVEYGDTVVIRGTLTLPENFITDSGKEFDYIHYLEKDSIFFSLNGDIENIKPPTKFILTRALFEIRTKVVNMFKVIQTKDAEGLIEGVLIGEKSSISKELEDSFIKTGTIHILALSGYNVSIVALWIQQFFNTFLSYTLSVWFGILGIIFFVLMTGSSSTAVRAGIMAVLVLIAKISYRPYEAVRILLIALLGMVVYNPTFLVYDISFQLSFLATASLIFIEPLLKKYFLWIKPRWLQSLVTATVAAQIGTLPYILFVMGNFSLVSLPVNILILPVIPILMFLGVVFICVQAVFPFLSFPLAFAIEKITSYITFITYHAQNLPFAFFQIKNVSLIVILIVYTSIIFWIWKENKKIEPSA